MKYSLGNFHLDTENCVITRASDHAVVTDNERMVHALKLLIEAHPEMAKKEELMAKLWPRDSISEWSLSRLIANLRVLLSAHDANTAYIKTIHGRGFRLGITPTPYSDQSTAIHTQPFVADLATEPLTTGHPQQSSSQTPQTLSVKFLTLISRRTQIVIGLILLGVLATTTYLKFFPQKKDWRVSEQVSSAYSEQIPLTEFWSEDMSSIEYKDGKIVFSPKNNDQRLAFYFRKPALLQNARFEFKLSVDQEYFESNPTIGLVAQVIRGAWPGEWSCPQYKPEKPNEIFTISCTIEEPNDYWKQETNESSRFALISNSKNTKGKISVHSASIHFPINLNVDSGWDNPRRKNYALYERGVSYKPKSKNDALLRIFKGPLDLRGKQIFFTLQTDSEFIETKMMIQPIAFKVMENIGMWNCMVFPEQMSPGGFMVRCPTIPNTDPFLLKENDYLSIGIQPIGDQPLKGSVKIIGISII